MGKFRSHGVLDAAFGYLADRADRLVLCRGMPETASAAMMPAGNGGTMLGFAALMPGLGQGDFIVAPGLKTGRRLVVAGAPVLVIEVDGVADHLALVGAMSGELLLVTPLAVPCAVRAGTTVAVAAFADEISDPV